MTEQLLIVDDNAAFLQVLERSMQRQGFTVFSASHHQQAITIATEQRLDFAIVDLNLDGDSGLALIPELKSLHPEIRMIILTGYSSIATAVEAVKLGAENYLCKPASSENIIQALRGETISGTSTVPDDPPSVDRLEWEHIQRVMQANDGNISATARALGMHRRTLQRKLQKRPAKR